MATCARILREKFPEIDEEMFSYINGKVVWLLDIVVVKFDKVSLKVGLDFLWLKNDLLPDISHLNWFNRFNHFKIIVITTCHWLAWTNCSVTRSVENWCPSFHPKMSNWWFYLNDGIAIMLSFFVLNYLVFWWSSWKHHRTIFRPIFPHRMLIWLFEWQLEYGCDFWTIKIEIARCKIAAAGCQLSPAFSQC